MAKNRYTQIIEAIFFDYYKEGDTEVPFERTDITRIADELDIRLPKNLGDTSKSRTWRSR